MTQDKVQPYDKNSGVAHRKWYQGRRWSSLSLRARILVLVTLGMITIIGLFSFFGITALQQSTQQTLEERRLLAASSASRLDFTLTQSLFQAANIGLPPSFDMGDTNWELKRSVLTQIRTRLPIVTSYLSLVDTSGMVRMTEPPVAGLANTNLLTFPGVKQALEKGTPNISNSYQDPSTHRISVYLSLPLTDDNGKVLGMVQAAIDLSHANLERFIQRVGPGRSGYAQIIDGNGIVLASLRSAGLLAGGAHSAWFSNLIETKKSAVSACHSCHVSGEGEEKNREIITFAPLKDAPWGVAIRQSEDEALAPTNQLQQRLILFGSLSFLAVVLVAWVTTESVRRPIETLTSSARQIAAGNLSESVPPVGEAEIGELARSLDLMRIKLKSSVEELQQRAEKLQDAETIRGELLRQLISAHEDERKRLARELHDETSQALTTLAVNLETEGNRLPPEQKNRLKEIQSLALRTLDEIHRMISDLRPSVLDDLGLIVALQWLADSHLAPAGIRAHVETAGQESRLPTEIETALFRITQEAITNIIRHAGAESVSITLEFKENSVTLSIEDDGRGFISENTLDKARSFGLLGMRERVELLSGSFTINSRPGFGTQILVEIPLAKGEEQWKKSKL